jgi:hypothetical protein
MVPAFFLLPVDNRSTCLTSNSQTLHYSPIAAHSVDQNHKLTVAQEAEQQRMVDLVAFFAAKQQAGKNNGQYSTADQARLQALVQGQWDRAAVRGQNLLCFLYGLCEPPVTGGEEGSKRAVFPRGVEAGNSPAGEVHVQPNPAAAYVVVRWHAPRSVERVELRDMDGRILLSRPVTSTIGETTLDTRTLANGVYSVVVYTPGLPDHVQRLIIQH